MNGDIDINKRKLRKMRLKNLKKGKVNTIGFIEALKLRHAGRRDGSLGLPKETDAGQWDSAYINRERDAYEELCGRMWGSLQVEEEGLYAHLEELTNSIAHRQAQLAESRLHLEESIHNAELSAVFRKKGEEKLTDLQVKTRRENERNKKFTALREFISSLEKSISEDIDMFLELRSRIVEDNNTTRMICNRIKEHIMQRIDIYWNAAYLSHPNGEEMPAVPAIVLTFRAEEVYAESHRKLMDKVEDQIGRLSEGYEKEAVINVGKKKTSAY